MEIFFYGLFMDVDILMKKGIQPSNPRTGYINNYTLKIGNRASLIPRKNEKSYGIVMTIDKNDVQKLYSEASVADYIPQEITVVTNNNTLTAICYLLPPDLLTGTNKSYAALLYDLAKRLGFPDDYLKKIKMMSLSAADS